MRTGNKEGSQDLMIILRSLPLRRHRLSQKRQADKDVRCAEAYLSRNPRSLAGCSNNTYNGFYEQRKSSLKRAFCERQPFWLPQLQEITLISNKNKPY